MANASSCTNVATNISIARGSSFKTYCDTISDSSMHRKGKDYTYLYGKHVGVGSLTPFIDKAFDSRIDE